MWNHPEGLYVEEDCYEVAGVWEEVYKFNAKLETEGEWDCVQTVELITM